MRKVAFLMLAKGNSKRLPNKNKKTFAGKPLFTWNLSKALEITKNVYFNSDDVGMINIARLMKAHVLERNTNLRDHDVPSRVLFNSSLKKMPKDIEVILSIQANSPNIEPKLIKTCFELMKNNNFDELLTCDVNYNIYGSLWGLSRKRVMTSSLKISLNDKKTQKPDCLILDRSVDIHTLEEFKKSLRAFNKTRKQ